jgi:hypothetical protein
MRPQTWPTTKLEASVSLKAMSQLAMMASKRCQPGRSV